MNEQEISTLDIYLVEPSHTQALIIKQHLRSCGIESVTNLSTGSELLAQLKHCRPDLIISSMYLPDMTGVDLIHAIRSDSQSYDMAYLLISSETNINYLEPIRQAGAIAILPKPFTQEELETALYATVEYLHPEKIHLQHFDIEDMQVLLVDDSEFSLKYIRKVLSNIGIERVMIASNGKQGLQLYREYYFDLIITDYHMPEMDGVQMVQAMREDLERTMVPILMVTSEQNQNRLAAIEKAGVSAILDKPFEPSSVKRLIMQLLG